MHRQFFYGLLVLLSTSCSRRMIRTGYEVKRGKPWDCGIITQKNTPIPATLTPIGEITFGDCKHSKLHTEAQVLEQIKQEGCAIDAELANVTNENSPELWNTCYQCRVQFYVAYKNPVDYSTREIPESSELSKNQKIALAAVITTLALAFWIYTHL